MAASATSHGGVKRGVEWKTNTDVMRVIITSAIHVCKMWRGCIWNSYLFLTHTVPHVSYMFLSLDPVSLCHAHKSLGMQLR